MERQGIAKLLEAEAKAKDIIEAAKKERAALQKQSKIEADQSIAEFKATKDAEHKQITASIDTSDFSKKLNEQTDKEIAAMKVDSKKSLDEISQLLLRYVADVNTDVHVNNQKVEAK